LNIVDWLFENVLTVKYSLQKMPWVCDREKRTLVDFNFWLSLSLTLSLSLS